MYPTIHAHLANNHGLISRRQAIALGLDDDEINRLVRSGAWRTVRRGMYAERHHWDSLDRFSGQPLARVRAAHLMMVTEHVLSHHSAALVHGLPILFPDKQLVHITRPGVLGSRTRYGVKHHRALYHEDQVIDLAGLEVLDIARTAVDIAREQGYAGGLVACDGALRHGVSRHQLRKAYEPMAYWPGIRTVRRCVADADAGAGSVGETLSRTLVEELGIGEPETQFVLDDGHRWVSCDLRVGRHVFEFDGRVKYERVEDGGVAQKDPREVLWDEKQRQDFIAGLGFGISRIVWADLWGRRREVTRARLSREYATTEARFGNSLDEVAAYVGRRGVA